MEVMQASPRTAVFAPKPAASPGSGKTGQRALIGNAPPCQTVVHTLPRRRVGMVCIMPTTPAKMALVLLVTLAAACKADAGCRAGDAAARGSQMGFQRAQANALTISQSQTQAQALLQKCLSGIANMQTVSMFPSLSNVLDQMVQKVCNAATQQVNSVIGQMTPQNDLDQIINHLNAQAQNATGGLVANPIVTTPISTLTGTAAPSAIPVSTAGADFWQTIWK